MRPISLNLKMCWTLILYYNIYIYIYIYIYTYIYKERKKTKSKEIEKKWNRKRKEKNPRKFGFAQASMCNYCNHENAWENSKIITAIHVTIEDVVWRQLNRDDGGLLPEAYLHLVNRWCHHQSLRV